MITAISPAKRLDMDRTADAPRTTRPRLLARAEPVAAVLRGLSAAKIAALMGVSDEIARLNVERFRAWSPPFTVRNATRAILAFDGDVYAGIARDAYDRDDFAFAQRHLRILSGLYGLLRPLDLIQAYRLEMGTNVRIGPARNLYEHWREPVTALLARDLRASGTPALVNLASDEYFKAVVPSALGGVRVIKPVFKEKRGSAYTVIAFNAKRARGAITDFIIRERIDDPEDLRRFARDGYRFAARRSSDDEWVFTRG